MFVCRFIILFVFCLTAFVGEDVAYAQTPTPNGYIGVVSKSDDRKTGERFTFANLRSEQPFVTYPSGHGGYPTKLFEDSDLIILLFVGQNFGSTEMFYLDKNRNRFTLVEVGALEARVNGREIRPHVTYGTIK